MGVGGNMPANEHCVGRNTIQPLYSLIRPNKEEITGVIRLRCVDYYTKYHNNISITMNMVANSLKLTYFNHFEYFVSFLLHHAFITDCITC